MSSTAKESKHEWIIQKCINAAKNDYQAWEGYCEKFMTRDEAMISLKECNEQWPYEFRAHKVRLEG